MESVLYSGTFSPRNILMSLPLMAAFWAAPFAVVGVIMGAIAHDIGRFVMGAAIVGAMTGVGISFGMNGAVYVAAWRNTPMTQGMGGVVGIAFAIVTILVLILK